MRIRRFEAVRYAHISGLALDLPDDAALHVVFGPNEAGKSTVLAAVADALFGFKHVSSAGFIHPQNTLCVAMEIAAADGGRLAFQRKKGRAATLYDEGGATIPEFALAPFLAGVDRDTFEKLFGLDGEQLRAARSRLLKTGGETGAGLADAAALGAVQETLAKLREEAKRAWHPDGRSKSDARTAADAWRASRQAMQQASLRPQDWVAADNAVATAERRLDEAKEHNRALAQQAAKLRRLQAAAPMLLGLDDARNRLANLAGAPDLDTAEIARVDKLLETWRTSAEEAKRERDEAAKLDERITNLARDPRMALAAPTLRDVLGKLEAVAKTRVELPKQRAKRSEASAKLERAADALGRAHDPRALWDALPTEAARAGLKAALEERSKLVAAAEERRKQRDEMEDELRAREVELADMPAARGSATALQHVIEAILARGDLDKELDAARDAEASSRDTLASELAALPLWTGGDAAALAVARLPLAETEAAAAERLGEAQRHAKTLGGEAAAWREKRDAAAATLAGFATTGAVPTREAVADARLRRDQALAELLAGARGEAEAKHRALSLEADRLADRRADQAASVAEFEAARRQEGEAIAALARLLPEIDDAASALRTTEAAWAALWPDGVEARDPKEMASWRRSVARVRERADAAAAKAKASRDAADALRRACNDLAEALGVQPADRGLAVLLADARAEQERRHARETLAADIAKTRQALAAPLAVSAADAAWARAWPSRLAAAGLDASTSPEGAAASLDAWAVVAVAAPAWGEADKAIRDGEKEVSDFEAALRALPLEPPLEPWSPAVRPRLEGAQETETQHATWTQDRDARLRKAKEAAEAAETARQAIGHLAPAAATPEQVGDALVRATAWRTADDDEKDLLDKLRERGGEAKLREECAGFDTDGAAARLAEIDAGGTDRDTALADLGSQLTRAQAELATLGAGRDATKHQREAAEAAAQARDAAQRFARLQLAATLLGRGLERFRQENQGPLVQAASRLFAALTGGRYARLEVEDVVNGTANLVAITPEESHCPMDALSDGTRDQLCLALRLAAVELRGAALPFVADDLLASFDDDRALLALRLLAAWAGQTILLTHHRHLFDLAQGIPGVSRHDLADRRGAAA